MGSSSNRDEAGYLSTFMIGALVGAGVALLFAPQAGVQLRGFLRDSVARAKEELDEAAEYGTEVLDDAIAAGHEFVEKGEEPVQEVRRKGKGFSEAGRNAVKGAKDELASPK